jgi:N-acetylglucosamine kinase-like BadF-type ATPase
MIYLAESGSTKTDAVLLSDSGEEVLRFGHIGLNPYFYDADMISAELKKVPQLTDRVHEINQVYFYAAGSSSEFLANRLKEGLARVFKDAEVQVDHDLMACAYATYSGEPGISCILGTGSNSIYFDGTHTEHSNSGMGFILGDEGSASYIGKRLLRGYFYQRMPEEFRPKFARQYRLDKDYVIKRVYQEEHANVFLASFAPFASENIGHPFFWEIVFSGFKEFLENHVLCFPQARRVPVHFVGSIAWYFSEILRNVMDHLDLKPGQIVQKPLDKLIEYHRKYIFTLSSSNI